MIRHRRGFTFAEVMFAVILLGIGFIMLAGMFPVAIQQTQLTQEETAGANIAHSAANLIAQVAQQGFDSTNDGFVTTGGQLRVLPGGVIARTAGDQIHSQDRRFAWTGLYRRNEGDNFIEVVIIAAQSHNAPEFNALDLNNGNLLPALIDADVNLFLGDLTKAEPFNRDRAIFDFSGRKDQMDSFDRLAPGAFIAYAVPGGPVHLYRLAEQFDTGNAKALGFYLAPGYELRSIDDEVPDLDPKASPPAITNGNILGNTNANGVNIFVLGRGQDPAANKRSYIGPAMDIAAYVTSIPLKK